MTTLLVASSGGHLDELVELAPRFADDAEDLVWVTPATAHAESLLTGQSWRPVAAIGSRQLGRAVAALPTALTLLRHVKPRLVVSTGAALCLPYLLAARLHRVPVEYVDSATRLRAPSLTGRLVSRLPGAALGYQSSGWPGPWREIPSVFRGFATQAVDAVRPRRIVVMLGTERFPFARAVELAAAGLPDDADITWQLGNTAATTALTGDIHDFLPFAALRQRLASADAVVTHAGVGSILATLRAGKVPVVMARRAHLGEHIDDHQVELLDRLAADGVVVSGEQTSVADAIRVASSLRAVRSDDTLRP